MNNIIINNKQENGNNIIKAFVMTSSIPSGNIAYKTVVEDGVQMYKGLPIEIFHQIMNSERMKDYTVEYTYSKEGETDYSMVIDKIAAGEYDIGIGVFNRTVDREKKVNFSAPFILDPNAVFHEETDNLIRVINLTLKSVVKIIAIIISLGIVAGMIIYFGNPGRMQRLDLKTNRKFFLYSIIAGMSAMFGEMGLVADQATRSIKGLLIFFVIMLTAFIFVLIAQARMTSTLVDDKLGSKITKHNFPRKKILGLEGYIPTTSIQELGARIEIMKDITIDELFQLYMKNTHKYSGVAVSYCDGFPYLEKYPTLIVSHGFGIETGGYPINQMNIRLSEDINNGIVELLHGDIIKSLCQSYYGDVEGNPVCSL